MTWVSSRNHFINKEYRGASKRDAPLFFLRRLTPSIIGTHLLFHIVIRHIVPCGSYTLRKDGTKPITPQ